VLLPFYTVARTSAFCSAFSSHSSIASLWSMHPASCHTVTSVYFSPITSSSVGPSLDASTATSCWRVRRSALTQPQRRKVALDVAKGMHYLHTAFQLPIIHRDLKSPNLLLLNPPDLSSASL
jgi:serine/threonine protein kinase